MQSSVIKPRSRRGRKHATARRCARLAVVLGAVCLPAFVAAAPQDPALDDVPAQGTQLPNLPARDVPSDPAAAVILNDNPTGVDGTTPVQRGLPDQATADETSGQIGIGVSSLIVAGVLLSAVVVSLIIFLVRRSWSAST